VLDQIEKRRPPLNVVEDDSRAARRAARAAAEARRFARCERGWRDRTASRACVHGLAVGLPNQDAVEIGGRR
jgi:hypothetical protein